MEVNMSSSMSDIRHGLRETKSLEALADAFNEPVRECYLALVSFSNNEDAALLCPAPDFVQPIAPGEYIHVIKIYNKDWMIGRIVDHYTEPGFMPTETKLREIVRERNAVAAFTGLQTSIEETTRNEEDDYTAVYQRAPILRPIVLVGPSACNYQLTKLLQKPLLRFIKRQFADRLTTLTTDTKLDLLTPKQAGGLERRIYQEGLQNKLVLLDCGASYPSDLKPFNIHPLVVYVRVNRLKVLQTLAKEHHKDANERQQVLAAAHTLYELPANLFSLVLTDNNLDDACQNLELFIESYWACTHPPAPRPNTTNDNTT